MYWPVQAIQDDSIVDASGNKLEQTTANSCNLDRAKERHLSSTPLDLSGSLSDLHKPHEGESPLDLSLKPRKRHANSIETREMYLAHQQLFSIGKRPCTSATQMQYQQTPVAQTSVQGPNSYVDQRQTNDRQIPFQRQYLQHGKVNEHSQSVLEQRHAVEQRQALDQRQAFEQRQAIEQRQALEQRKAIEHRHILEQRQAIEERQRQVMEERHRQVLEERQRQAIGERHLALGYGDNLYKNKQMSSSPGYQEIQDMLVHRNTSQSDMPVIKHGANTSWPNQQVVKSKSLNQEHYRRASQIRYSNRMKTSPSSDEQYYAMLQTIQKQNAAKKQQIDTERLFAERAVRIQDAFTSTQPKLIPKASKVALSTSYIDRPAQGYLQNTSLVKDVDYSQRLWKAGYAESSQQRKIAESAQQHHSAENSHPKSVVKHGNMLSCYKIKQEHPDILPTGVYTQPFGNGTTVQLEQRRPYLNRSSQIPHSLNTHKEVLMADGHPPKMKGSMTSLSSEVISSQIPLQSERSIMKGTSGVYCFNGLQEPLQRESKKFTAQENIAKRSIECPKSCAGHEASVSSHKSSMVDQCSRQMQFDKLNKEEKKKERDDSLNDNRLVTQLFRGIIKQGGSLLSAKTKQTEGTKKSHETMATKSQESTVYQGDNVSEHLSSPLSISIPNASIRCETKEKSDSKPRPFSKKHIIMNAVKRDEDLCKIVNNSEKPKTVIFSNPDIKRSHTTSPVGPESPKMPTLSPQQKLQPSCLSQQVTEPPTLDIDGSHKQESCVRPGPSASYYQDKRPRLLSSLPRKPQPVIDDDEDDEDCGEPQHEVSIHDHSVFAKRPFLHYKKIPIANVAPMVHENSVGEQNEQPPNSLNRSTSYKRKLDETFDKHITSSIKTYLNENNETALKFSEEDKSPLDDIKYEGGKSLVKSRRLSDSECVIKSAGSDRNYKPLKIERRHKSLIQESSSNRRVIPELNKDLMIAESDKGEGRLTFHNRIGSTSKAQKKADDIRRRARERHHQRERNKKIQENQSLYIKSRRHSQDKARGFIDFKPEVLVNRTRTKTLKTEILSDSDVKTEDEEAVRCIKRRVYKKSGQRKTHKAASRKNSQELVENTDSPTGISLKIASIALTDCVGKNIIETKAEDGITKENLSPSKERAQVSRGNSRTSVHDEEKVSQDLSKKTLVRPKQKRRFRRRSSTKRIGKSRRRKAKYRNKQIATKKNFVPLTYQGDVDDDVFANDDVVGSSEKIYTGSLATHPNATDPQVALEIKKLVVCKDTGETMLHRAARLGHLDVVIYCLQSGDVDVNTKDNAGYTPLHECCVSGNLEIARLLLSRGANVNCASQDGIRPIHDAVENDNVEMVRLLIVYGADPTLATYGGVSPVKIAHSDNMRSLINGYLGDINGFSQDQNEVVWEFDLYSSGCLPETEIFSDIPEDPVIESKDQFLEESTIPLFPVIKCQNGENERYESFVLVRDICESYRINPLDVMKNLGNVSTRELSVEEILQNKDNLLLFQKLSVLSATQLPAVREESVNDLREICMRLSNSAETSVKISSTKGITKDLPSLSTKNSIKMSPHKQNILDTKFVKHSPKDISKRKTFERKQSPKNNLQKETPKPLPCKKKLIWGDDGANKPSTSGHSNAKGQLEICKSKPSRGVFDLTSDDESTDDDFPAWERATDLKVVKYRHDNIELVSKSSSSKIKHKN